MSTGFLAVRLAQILSTPLSWGLSRRQPSLTTAPAALTACTITLVVPVRYRPGPCPLLLDSCLSALLSCCIHLLRRHCVRERLPSFPRAVSECFVSGAFAVSQRERASALHLRTAARRCCVCASNTFQGNTACEIPSAVWAGAERGIQVTQGMATATTMLALDSLLLLDNTYELSTNKNG